MHHRWAIVIGIWGTLTKFDKEMWRRDAEVMWMLGKWCKQTADTDAVYRRNIFKKLYYVRIVKLIAYSFQGSLYQVAFPS